MRLRSGMNVRVVSGNHKGKEGKILKVIKDKNRIIIEGVNLIKKHTRPTQDNPKGGIVEKEGSIHISNVMYVHNISVIELFHHCGNNHIFIFQPKVWEIRTVFI